MNGVARAICGGDTVLLADVGNSRIKLAVSGDHGDGRTLPTITRRHDLDSHAFRSVDLEQWLQGAAPGPAVVLVASVHDAAAARLEAALAAVSATGHRPLRQRRIVHADLPLSIAIPDPDCVGIDRLCGAAAATFAGSSGRATIVVDCGTAATINMVAADGRFLGGAILPGPALMARALADGTSKLPEVAALGTSAPPPMPGRSTPEAIAAGIGFGIQGAVARLVAEARGSFEGRAEVILTGGWRGAVRAALPGATEIPDLVLHGIALAAQRACAR
ncbi:MAG: type III pantothenate kinase [Planctomycetia bacterium]|nr:type III pantothenate kinase [Planctomycetia bacterium]